MRILAVEDEPEYLEMLSEVMKSLGHSIIIAASGSEALDIVDKHKIDVVVSDVKMPGMDGIELLSQVRVEDGGPGRRTRRGGEPGGEQVQLRLRVDRGGQPRDRRRPRARAGRAFELRLH
mgnify:CR=1 FL=1